PLRNYARCGLARARPVPPSHARIPAARTSRGPSACRACFADRGPPPLRGERGARAEQPVPPPAWSARRRQPSIRAQRFSSRASFAALGLLLDVVWAVVVAMVGIEIRHQTALQRDWFDRARYGVVRVESPYGLQFTASPVALRDDPYRNGDDDARRETRYEEHDHCALPSPRSGIGQGSAPRR